MTGLSLATMAVLASGLTTLGVGLGAVFTYFKADNASQISTSLGGYLYVMASVTYISLVLLLEATPVRVYYRRQPDLFLQAPWEVAVPALFLLASFVVATWVPMAVGEERLERQEI
jgi:hypothetical protein